MKRLATFFRSVLPTDPWQLSLLLGAACLTFCTRLRWLPETSDIAIVRGDYGELFSWRSSFRTLLVLAMYPIIFSSLAGYFVCFWPGLRPLRRVLLSVLMPAFAGLAAIFVMLAISSSAYVSVLQSNSSRAKEVLNALFFFGKNSLGLHFCLLGFLLVSIFAVRLSLARSHLPITLQGLQAGEEDKLWHRTKVLLYLMIGPMFFVEMIAALPTIVVFLAGIHFNFGTVWTLSSELAAVFLDLCVALWVIDKTGRKMILGELRIPGRNFFLFALGSASAIAAAIPAAVYLYDRAHWAAFEYRNSPPDLTDYFATPGLWVVGAIAGAFIEEVIFRGFVQRKMVERYGQMPGIFVTGIAWAAAHFRTDAYPRYSDLRVVIHLILRIAMCVALSFVFSWLTLKSKSILPAMLAHAGINFFAGSAVTFEQLPGESQWAINIALWAILAYVLFRYWPPQSTESVPPAIHEGEAAPAT